MSSGEGCLCCCSHLLNQLFLFATMASSYRVADDHMCGCETGSSVAYFSAPSQRYSYNWPWLHNTAVNGSILCNGIFVNVATGSGESIRSSNMSPRLLR